MSFFIIIVIYEGNVGIFGFAGIASFGSVIRFLQTAVFRVWCLVPFTGFLQFIGLWVSAFLNNNCGYFGFFGLIRFTTFLVLPRTLHTAVALKRKFQ